MSRPLSQLPDDAAIMVDANVFVYALTPQANLHGPCRDLRQARIDILPLTYRDLHASRVYREQHGMLVNDSLIVAVMQRERMQFLATNDSDFERVPGIAVYMPLP